MNIILTIYKFRQYDEDEKTKYQDELKKLFDNKEEQLKIQGNGDIIHIAELNYFLKHSKAIYIIIC